MQIAGNKMIGRQHQPIQLSNSSNSAQTSNSIGSPRDVRLGRHQNSSSRTSNNEFNCDPQNPYPLYAPISFFYLSQTAKPRSWCLAIVSNKYPDPFNCYSLWEVSLADHLIGE